MGGENIEEFDNRVKRAINSIIKDSEGLSAITIVTHGGVHRSIFKNILNANKKIEGIDVDNTITDTLPVLKKYCKEYNDKVIKRNLSMNKEGFAVANLYEWTEDEKTDFLIKYIDEVRGKAKIKQNAQKVIQKLKQEGNTIYIITARKQIKDRNPYKITQEFLQNNNIQYDELVIQKNKKQFCIDNNIEVLIDDESQNINSVSEVIPVIVFEAVHNKKCSGSNIIKVNTWDEVYNIIKNMN